jgi:hypothetical protein
MKVLLTLSAVHRNVQHEARTFSCPQLQNLGKIALNRALFQVQRASHYDAPGKLSTSLPSFPGRTIMRRTGHDDWSMSCIVLYGSENETIDRSISSKAEER